jgi:ketosteroid isomerase-like protein
MKSLACGILGMLMMTGLALAQPKKTAGEDVAATLKALSEKWVQSQLKGDAVGLGSVLADTLTAVSNTGEVRTKAETLARLKSGTLKFTSATVDDMHVTVYGDFAVVVGRWAGKGTDQGKAFDASERFTDTWTRQNGQWRCVASQGTLLQKK